MGRSYDAAEQEDKPQNNDNKTQEEFKKRLTCILEQMMFVSGETGDPSPETTGIIEEIVRQQVTEIVSIERS